jgi:SAM-dependent methyltransferase
MDEAHRIFDRDLLRRRKDRFAATAGEHDFLLQNATQDILDRLRLVKRTFPIVLNIGAYHSPRSLELSRIPGVQKVVNTENSAILLGAAGGLGVLADEEALPFEEASADLVISVLALQHVNDLPGTLIQIRRALKPDGLFMGAIFGGETLQELREAWLTAEAEIEGGASPRVHPFVDVREAGALLQRAGFALPVADSDRLTVTYKTPLELMVDLRAMGASNALLARRRKPVSRKLLNRASEIYADRFSEASGRIRATFEIISLTAWAPHDSQQKPLPRGTAKVRLADALGSVEHPLPRREKP